MVRVSKLELHRAIYEIMGKGNLDHLTTKKIRNLCEQKYNTDLTARKQEVDKVVMEFVLKKSADEKMAQAKSVEPKPVQPKPVQPKPVQPKPVQPKPIEPKSIPKDETDGSADDEEGSSYDSDEEGSSCSSRSGSQSCSDSDCSLSESSDEAPSPKAEAAKKVQAISKPGPKVHPKKTGSVVPQKTSAVSQTSARKSLPPNKKPKKDVGVKKVEMDDASYARQLQAEEWSFRQITSRKLFRDIPQKKGGKNEQAKKKKASPFMKKCALSPALAELMGTNEMSRPNIVQKMWSVVRERELLDPSNKQYAKCDEQLMKLFGKKRVRLIGMMKYLKHHIKDIS